MKLKGLRETSGRFSTAFEDNVLPRSVRAGSASGADDDTITSVVTPVSCNLTSMVAVEPAFSAIPLCSYRANPGASTVKEYRPRGSTGSLYKPEDVVVVIC